MPRRRLQPTTLFNIGTESGGWVEPLHPDAKTFWVDPTNGTTGASGLDWDQPAKSINQVLEHCVAHRGDVIYCLPGSHVVTEVQDIDVAGVTIAAVGYGGNRHATGEKFTINAASSYTDGPAVKITQPCRIVGMGIAGRQTAGESLLIDCEETGGFSAGFIEIINCRFSCWYGAMDALIRCKGGQLNRIEGCTFDGLFGGVGTAGIILETDVNIDPGFYQIHRNYFYEMGTGNHALKVASGDTAIGLAFTENYVVAGFGGNQGKAIDFTSTDSYGIVGGNWLAPLADQVGAFENIGSYAGGFADNHYEES